MPESISVVFLLVGTGISVAGRVGLVITAVAVGTAENDARGVEREGSAELVRRGDVWWEPAAHFCGQGGGSDVGREEGGDAEKGGYQFAHDIAATTLRLSSTPHRPIFLFNLPQTRSHPGFFLPGASRFLLHSTTHSGPLTYRHLDSMGYVLLPHRSPQ